MSEVAVSAPRWPRVEAIEWTAPSSLFKVEREFTSWLASHLELIASALGLEELELVGTEVQVAGKKLDILAGSASDPSGLTVGVAIEAQYGESDHDHLGKLVTYSAGATATKDRVLAVWLVDRAHPAHTAAVEMLNRETTDRLGFVLAKMRFISTGPESWAVDVEIIEKPNEFIRAQQKEAGTPPNPARHEFLTNVLDLARPQILAAGFSDVSQSRDQGYYATIRWPNERRWHIDVRGGQRADGFRARVYADVGSSTAENEVVLRELAVHDALVREQLKDTDSVVDWKFHVTNPWSTRAAIGDCKWPAVGYSSDPQLAASYLVAFCRGVAFAARAAAGSQVAPSAPASASPNGGSSSTDPVPD